MLPPLSVFLVEDEVLIRMMIAEMVDELGHRVVAEAGSVAEAAQVAASAKFDLAVLDINLRGENVLPLKAAHHFCVEAQNPSGEIDGLLWRKLTGQIAARVR